MDDDWGYPYFRKPPFAHNDDSFYMVLCAWHTMLRPVQGPAGMWWGPWLDKFHPLGHEPLLQQPDGTTSHGYRMEIPNYIYIYILFIYFLIYLFIYLFICLFVIFKKPFMEIPNKSLWIYQYFKVSHIWSNYKKINNNMTIPQHSYHYNNQIS